MTARPGARPPARRDTRSPGAANRRLAAVPDLAPAGAGRPPTRKEAAAWLRGLLADGLSGTPSADPALARLLEEAASLAGECLSPLTLDVYGGAWAEWARWCDDRRVQALPADPAHVAAYLAGLYDRPVPLRPSTAATKVTAINTAHRLAGFAEPARTGPARAVQNGARRRHGTATVAEKAPLTLDALRPAVAAALDDPARRRDRMVAALSAAGLRPARIASLTWQDLRPDDEGGGWQVRPARRGRPWLGVPVTAGPGCAAAAISAARTGATGPVTAGTDGTAMTPQGVGKAVRRLSAAHGAALPDTARPVLGRVAGRAVLAGLAEPGLAEHRDAALLLLGFVGALRRSGLASLRWQDLAIETDGSIRVTVRRQKNDVEGRGHAFWAAPGDNETTCPVAAVERWRAALAAATGTDPAGTPAPLFCRVDRTGRPIIDASGNPLPLTPEGVADTVARACERAGHPPGRYGSHSLRSGMITEAAGIEGVTVLDIQLTTGHQHADSVLRYVRPVAARRRNPTRRMGL